MTEAIPQQTVRIVFVGGYARTGSTLLDRLLGQIDGLASFGELRHIWERGFIGNQLCGCGRAFRDCPFWSDVANEAFGGFDGVDAWELGRLARSVDTFWNIPRIVTGGSPGAFRVRLQTYTAAVASLYAAMHRVAGGRIIVDSTKDPQHAYLLRSIPGFDVRVIHLVRDPRAVAYSWTRTRRRPEIHWREQDMPRFPIARSAAAWTLANLATDGLHSGPNAYVRIRYEDLVADTRATLEHVIGSLDLGPADLSYVEDGHVRLAPAHTMAGNPIRFASGEVAMRLDDEWRTGMRGPDRSLATVLTSPAIHRYGYRFRTRHDGQLAMGPDARPSAGIQVGEGPGAREMWRIGGLAIRHRSDPMPYARAVADLAVRYLRARGLEIEGRWLDVGTGNGVLPVSVTAAGARLAIGLDTADRRIDGARCHPFVLGRAQELPFADGTFDGVLSSNVLEHTGDVSRSLRELLRVSAPGGIVYLSWTNWYSPMGGHEWSPFHYLGPRLGPRAYRIVRGKPPPWNLPGRTLFPVHVGAVLREIHRLDACVVDVVPRYWPRLRWLSRVPLIREVAMWNCVILLRPGGRNP